MRQLDARLMASFGAALIFDVVMPLVVAWVIRRRYGGSLYRAGVRRSRSGIGFDVARLVQPVVDLALAPRALDKVVMRLGILGGTFDPPHNGHLVIAEQARARLALAQVLFIPAHRPPHKQSEPVSPLADRVAMLKLALAAHPHFVLSLVEANRSGLSYTVDTLRELKREFPPETELFFILGMDSLRDLPTWYKPREIIALCQLAVLKRPGYAAHLEQLEQKIPGLGARVVFVPAPESEVSSSEIQARVREGLAIKRLVPHAVAEYIRQHGLYLDVDKRG